MSISARHISKNFGEFKALDDISLEVPAGSLTALLGPSGSGKSTLLRVIAGLETPDAGSVFIDEQNVTGRPPQERQVGFVFQHYAAFKHMTVHDNVAFGLKVRKAPKSEIEPRVRELLALVQLEGLAERYPSQLSGGQRQRMGLARALAVDPTVLLLDEPFGALDARVRTELRIWLRRLHDETHTTTVIVTHDQEEAMEVADNVVVMNKGRIEQISGPRELYERPANEFVMTFVGSGEPDGRRLRAASRCRAHARAERLDARGDDRAGRASGLRGSRRARRGERRGSRRPAHARRGGAARARAGSDRVPQADPPDVVRLSNTPSTLV